mgnify:CR=1 FL=1
MGRSLFNAAVASGNNAVIDTTSYYADNYISSITHNNHMEYWELSFTKQKAADESYIWVKGILCGEGHVNYPIIGMYVTIDDYGRNTNDSEAFGGIGHCGPDGNSDREGCLFVIDKTFTCTSGVANNSNMDATFPASELGVGAHKINIGHCTRDNANARPTVMFNPDSSRQNRHQNTTSSYITIMELTY